MIGRQCCRAGRAPKRVARLFSTVAASILPAALLAFLPKCPLCLAAWLTLATGFSFPVTGVSWARTGIVLLWVASVGSIIWRRGFGSAAASYGRGKKMAR